MLTNAHCIMTVQTFGSLSDNAVQADLARAQSSPESWTIYLVRANGQLRTPAQNRLFQTILRKLAQQQGKSVQYWYDYLVERFLGYVDVETPDGDLRQILAPTSALSVDEFSGFLNACLAFAADLQVH